MFAIRTMRFLTGVARACERVLPRHDLGDRNPFPGLRADVEKARHGSFDAVCLAIPTAGTALTSSVP